MNRALLPRDSDGRSGAPGGQSGHRRSLPSAFRLVRRIANPPERTTPPSGGPAARCGGNRKRSGFDGIAALPVLALRGCHSQAHLLPNRARQEPANRMGLPAGRFHQLLAGNAARPLEQFEDRLGLAAFAGALLLGSFPRTGCFWLRGRFGRFLGWAGLLPRLPLLRRDVRATCATTGLLGRLRLGRRCSGRRFGLFSIRCHIFSLAVITARDHMDHSGGPEKQVKSASWEGDGTAMRPRRCQ